MIYNDTLKKRHENTREETINQILDAIATIKTFEGENASITAKKIMENSSLSKSVLYKEHTLKIWNPSAWEKRYNPDNPYNENHSSENQEKLLSLISELENKLKKQEGINKKLNADLEKEKKRNEVYQMDIEEMKVKNQKLLGECQKLSSILNSKGIQI